jgi:hypothetical protein
MRAVAPAESVNYFFGASVGIDLEDRSEVGRIAAIDRGTVEHAVRLVQRKTRVGKTPICVLIDALERWTVSAGSRGGMTQMRYENKKDPAGVLPPGFQDACSRAVFYNLDVRLAHDLS